MTNNILFSIEQNGILVAGGSKRKKVFLERRTMCGIPDRPGGNPASFYIR
jgi:hypothetical protein